ncbi:ABC-type spermidine/putrescine transport system permease subunit I [Microbacteriaceae bacterium MWH-Ta3]|nr:ABC-type spermidine/putrescine transport system permease subunit I [Microbacteriaceae bacterium MWH-Ta3]
MAIGAFSHGPSGVTTDATVQRSSRIAWLLLLPGIAYLILFFLVPLASLVMTSFQETIPGGFIGEYQNAFRWENYVEVLGLYGEHTMRSFLYAATATIIALIIGYPLAYFIGVKLRRFPLLQSLALVLVIAPFFISFLLRTLAWKQILADEGFVVATMKTLQLLPDDAHITGTAISVVFGLAYNFIPFMTLPLYTTLERLDLRLVEAGSDLYANPFTTFVKVTVPLTMPGIISGTLLTFIPAAGDYVNASANFLGSTSTAMIGNVIESNFLVLQNFPHAASMSLILMSAILVLVATYVKKSGTEDLL